MRQACLGVLGARARHAPEHDCVSIGLGEQGEALGQVALGLCQVLHGLSSGTVLVGQDEGHRVPDVDHTDAAVRSGSGDAQGGAALHALGGIEPSRCNVERDEGLSSSLQLLDSVQASAQQGLGVL